VKPVFAWKYQLTWRELTLIPLAVLAIGLASILSLPGSGAWAAQLSPISPPSSSSPSSSQPSVAAPTAAVGSAPAPAVSSAEQATGGTASLVAGGIVLAGLIVGAVVLLVRGQPSDEPQDKE
jgi:hypothetical protein